MSRLAEIAPRLALAWEGFLADERRRREAADDVLRLERLVAHRELQLARAGARGDGAYIARRYAKLRMAEAALARARRRQRGELER